MSWRSGRLATFGFLGSVLAGATSILMGAGTGATAGTARGAASWAKASRGPAGVLAIGEGTRGACGRVSKSTRGGPATRSEAIQIIGLLAS